MFCIKAVNEASEKDFAGKDTIIVISAITGRRVEKTAAQKARDARDPDAFDDGYAVRPMGAEMYYLTDRATADDLTSTDLFYSSVRPESEQLFFKLRNLTPVIVHTTGTRGSRSTNFGYRESNEFEDNCASLKQVMEGAFGAKNVRIFNFKTAHNDRLRFVEFRGDGQPAVEDWGEWYEVADLERSASGAGKRLLRPVVKSWREVIPALRKQPLTRPSGEFDEFFAELKPLRLSLQEQDVTPAAMMDDFVGEALKQAEFDFSERRDADWKPVLDQIRSAEANEAGFRVRRVADRNGLLSAKPGQDAVAEYFREDGSLVLEVRFGMQDPLDSEFYEDHHPLLGAVAGNMPKGFVAEFAEADASGSSGRFIGTKEVLSRDVSRESGPEGVESTDTYDVIETLVIRRADAVSEAEDNPDDAKTDDLFVKGDEYEARLSDGLAESDGDFIEVDFPAWALDYAVNAEIGSVSRSEKFAVDKWFEMIGREGYDTGLVSYGDEEYFSSEPEFGLPCDCVKARLPKKVLGEGEYPDYSGNAHKNRARMTYGGTQTPKSAVFAKGVDVKPLTVGQLLAILQDGRQAAPAMFIQRRMNGERASSASVSNAHPFRLERTKEGQKAIVMFDGISFPKRSFASVDRTPSTAGEISAELEKLGGTSLGKGVGIASYSNRMQAIRAVYAAYFKDGRFYMETKQNTVSEDGSQDVVAKYLGELR